MGMFDKIEGTVRCPYCGEQTIVNCQIKWLTESLRKCKTYHVGDKIPCVDAIYTGGSTVRTVLVDKCKNCNHSIKMIAKVLNGKLDNISPVV